MAQFRFSQLRVIVGPDLKKKQLQKTDTKPTNQTTEKDCCWTVKHHLDYTSTAQSFQHLYMYWLTGVNLGKIKL